MKRLLLVLAVAALGAAAAAHAAPPTSTTFATPYTGTLACPGFDILFSGNVSIVDTLYSDNRGAPIREHLHIAFQEADTNSVTGKTIPLRGDINIDLDMLTGNGTLRGELNMSNVPGSGHVIQDTGRIIATPGNEILFEAGPHQKYDSNDAIYCQVLA